MGYDYYIYAEGKEKDGTEWLLLDGYYKDSKGKLVICPAYSCYSRSSFGEAYDELYRQSHKISEKDLSEDLRRKFEEEDEKYIDDHWQRDLMVVDFQNVLDAVGENRYTHHAFVHKDMWQEWLTDGLWELYPEDDDKSFLDYTPEERSKLYEYHEWDNYDDWLYHFKAIKDAVLKHRSDFETANYMARIDDIRLVIHRC